MLSEAFKHPGSVPEWATERFNVENKRGLKSVPRSRTAYSRSTMEHDVNMQRETEGNPEALFYNVHLRKNHDPGKGHVLSAPQTDCKPRINRHRFWPTS
jgi:hypothetical protein